MRRWLLRERYGCCRFGATYLEDIERDTSCEDTPKHLELECLSITEVVLFWENWRLITLEDCDLSDGYASGSRAIQESLWIAGWPSLYGFWKSPLKTYQSDWALSKWLRLKGNKVKTRSCELNLSLPNQTYSCHINWNWSNKLCVFVKQLVLSFTYLHSCSVSWSLSLFITEDLSWRHSCLLFIFVLFKFIFDSSYCAWC